MLSNFAQRLAVPLAVAVKSCGPKTGSDAPTAQSPERQAETEYDVARDLFQKGEPRQSLDHALKAVELDDNNAKVLYFTSNIYLFFCSTELGFTSPDCRLEDAERFARRAAKADPTFRDARNLLGVVLIARGKYQEAIQELEPLVRDPSYNESHLAWGNLGWAEVQAGQLDLGIKSLKNAVTEPKFCVGHYRLGVALEKKGDLAAAEQSFTNAVSVDDENCRRLQDAWEARGRVRQALGKTADAKADFDRCREISTVTQTGKLCLRALSQLGAGGAKAPSVP
jgi:Tfp pilus assembly protein PilF